MPTMSTKSATGVRIGRALWGALCLLVALTLVAAAPQPPSGPAGAMNTGTADPLVYAVDAVDGKLLRVDGREEWPLSAGDRAIGGSELRTGWFSSADLTARRAAAHFHLNSRTHVRLASETPGVLLVLERGRLRALFDKLTGDEAEQERRIETPSAILAVRGTEYGVAVGRGGATTLVVFEGVVEVLDPTGRTAPVQVMGGQALHLRRGEAPEQPFSHGLSRGGWDRGAMPPMTRPGGPESAPGPQGGVQTAPQGAGPHGAGPLGVGLQSQQGQQGRPEGASGPPSSPRGNGGNGLPEPR